MKAEIESKEKGNVVMSYCNDEDKQHGEQLLKTFKGTTEKKQKKIEYPKRKRKQQRRGQAGATHWEEI